MATTTLSTDTWVESSSPITSIQTDQWDFTLTPAISTTLSTDVWSFELTPIPATTLQSDQWAASFYQLTYALSQSVPLIQGEQYLFQYRLSTSGAGGVVVTVGSNYTHGVFNDTATITDYFTHAAVTGNYLVSFTPVLTNPSSVVTVSVEAVSLKQIVTPASTDNIPVKAFLEGTTDDDREITFRADTQVLQIQTNPEMYSTPIGILTEVDRGSMMKAFVSLDDKPFYELEGTATKGISNLKIGLTPPVDSDMSQNAQNLMAQSIQVSYRDSSRQLCRIIQAAIITIPTPIDRSP